MVCYGNGTESMDSRKKSCVWPWEEVIKSNLPNRHFAKFQAGLYKVFGPIAVVCLVGGALVSRSREGQSGYTAEAKVCAAPRTVRSPEAHTPYPPLQVIHSFDR